MVVLEKIAYFQHRQDDTPNQELAQELVAHHNRGGIQEIVNNLQHHNKNVQSDCIKVLYEIGYRMPELIADYVPDFLALLHSRNNRLVWGGMIALSTIASLRAEAIWSHIDDVLGAVANGSVITVVNGVKTLAQVAAADRRYSERLFPVMLDILRTCISRDVPTHAESMLCAVNPINRSEFISILTTRESEMTLAQRRRLRQVFKKLNTFASTQRG